MIEGQALESRRQLPVERDVKGTSPTCEVLVDLSGDRVESSRCVQHTRTYAIGQVLQDDICALELEATRTTPRLVAAMRSWPIGVSIVRYATSRSPCGSAIATSWRGERGEMGRLDVERITQCVAGMALGIDGAHDSSGWFG